MLAGITSNVYLLGLLSFFNDFSADMISPLLPAFLATMGLGAGFLGIMEGIANTLSHLMALLSGWMDDRLHRSKRIAISGYALCAFVRPFLAIPIPALTIAVRILDRIGKGIRTSPRDHLLTDSLEPRHWGKAFGIQRALDHAGALVGPPIAAWLLKSYALSYSKLFLIAALPAILSILFIPAGIQEKQAPKRGADRRVSWRQLPAPLKRYLAIIFLVAFSTPSELFLILRLQELGMKAYQAPLAWGLFTLCTLLAAFLGGFLADRWSQRRTIALGWTLFSAVYLAFAWNLRLLWAWVLIGLYGFQAGLVEASERAYPANLAPAEIRATALGWYYAAYGIGLLPASIMFGILWSKFSPRLAFCLFAGMTLCVIPMLAWLPTHRGAKGGLPRPSEAALR